MSNAKELTKIALFLTLIASVIYLSVTLGGTLNALAETTRDIHTDVGVTLAHADEVLLSVDHAAHTQDDYWTKEAGPELFKTGRAVRKLVDYTNKSLNEPTKGLLPTTALALELAAIDVDNTTKHASDSIDKLTVGGQATLDAGTSALDTLREQMNSPQIPELMGHLNTLALHLDGIAANGEKASADLGIAIHRLTQPPSKFHQFLTGAYTAGKVSTLFIP